jgi:hypothetical protein
VVSDDLFVDGFLDDRVKRLLILFPFFGRAHDLGSLVWGNCLNLFSVINVLLCGRMLFEFVLRIESQRALSTRFIPWLEDTSTLANILERGKSQSSQATVKQSLIDLDVMRQQLLEGAPKIGQIAP